MFKHRLVFCGVLISLLVPTALLSQDQPLNARATFSTGYYSTTSRGDINQSLSFVPFGARFDLGGYYVSPDLVTFSVQPELNFGPQASEAGFQGGNGIQLLVTFLHKLIPLTFHYTNIQVEDVYFGSLTQVSGYSLKNRNKDLGLTLELKPKNLPETIVDWGTGSVNSKASIDGVPDYVSNGNHLNVDSRYERSGWVTESFLHRQEQRSDVLEPVDGGTQLGSLLQTALQYQASVRRGFLDDSEVYVSAGRQSTSTLLFALPIDLATHYVNANLRFFQKRRWRTSVRAGYSSNLASQLLAQAAGSLGGASSIAPDQYVLLPFSHGISNLDLAGITSAALGRGFALNAGVERNTLNSSNQDVSLNARYLTATAGLTYAKKLSWGGLSGEYGREYGHGTLTGQSGTIQGQTYRAGFQRAGAGRFQVDGSVHGSDQSIHSAQPLSNRSIATEGSVGGRLFDSVSARVGGGWQWNSIRNSANEFRTNGYLARAGIEHPRFQVNATLNDSISNSLPFYNQLLGGLGLVSDLFIPVRPIPSDYRATAVNLHANPFRKVELSAMWSRSRQHLDSVLNNDFQIVNVYLTYHFRRIRMEAGFIRSYQVFAQYPDTLRARFYVRVVREVKIL